MKRLLKSICLCGVAGASLLSLSTAVNSQQQGVVFGGSVDIDRFCQIVIVQEGALAANLSRTVLSSRQPGGRVGRAQVRSSRALTGPQFVFSAEAPVGFITAPVELPPSVEFAATYQATADIFTFFDPLGNPNTTPVNQQALPELTTGTSLLFPRNAVRLDVDVNFDASTNNGDVFPPGEYSSVVTLRCE